MTQSTRTAIIVAFFALIAAKAATADEAETRDVDDFSQVQFSVPFDVEFVSADEPYVKLEGDADTIEEITTKVKGSTLRIGKDTSWFAWNDEEVLITIGYTELDAITLSGSGDGFAESIDAEEFKIRITGSSSMEVETMITDELHISIAGSGDVEIHELEADEVTSKIAGSGDISLAGRAVSQEVSISGSGDHDATELRTQETTASVRGSGDVGVWAESRLAASLVGSGDVRFYGNPELEERIVGSGEMRRLGDEP